MRFEREPRGLVILQDMLGGGHWRQSLRALVALLGNIQRSKQRQTGASGLTADRPERRAAIHLHRAKRIGRSKQLQRAPVQPRSSAQGVGRLIAAPARRHQLFHIRLSDAAHLPEAEPDSAPDSA